VKYDYNKSMEQKGFFDDTDRLRRLSELGDSLEKLNNCIAWEDFRKTLTVALKKEAQGPGGRPPYDYVMMFKILILQKIYNISDDQTEYQINDRLSFQRFIGIQLYNTVPDSKTIWHFREGLKEAGILDKVFNEFTKKLEVKGIITHSGSIVDASFVEVPRQRNTKKENDEIKTGKIPSEWQTKENRHKLAQKDTDARWMTKNKECHYGYKDHIKIDKKSKIITKYRVTSAEVHDSQEFKNLVDAKKDRILYGDSAYTGKEVQKHIPKNTMNRIHEKGYRNKPLTKTQKRNNTAKSRIRARVEHVFGALHHFGGLIIRTIGIERAKFQIGLMNLVYNMTRYTYLMGAKA
jgi:IS5 family transposase